MKKIKDIRNTIKGEDLPNIYLLHGDLTDEEMNELYHHPRVKAHATLTHGEGFGRPLLEASLSEKPVIASNWSGQRDFLPENLAIMLPGNLTKTPPEAFPENIYVEGSQWFSVDYPVASNVMKDVYTNYKKYVPNAKKLSFQNKNKFSLDAMTKEFEKILDKNPKIHYNEIHYNKILYKSIYYKKRRRTCVGSYLRRTRIYIYIYILDAKVGAKAPTLAIYNYIFIIQSINR